MHLAQPDGTAVHTPPSKRHHPLLCTLLLNDCSWQRWWAGWRRRPLPTRPRSPISMHRRLPATDTLTYLRAVWMQHCCRCAATLMLLMYEVGSVCVCDPTFLCECCS